MLEKTFYARHLLKTGSQMPEVISNKPATEHIQQAIDELDAVTERMLFEYRARQEIASDSLAALLTRVHAFRTESEGTPELGPIDRKPLIDGRVIR